ncbi:MAG: EF-Tu/IF-2/RF-3 family GTPase, partial [Patescibacteria group bacterium]
GLRICGVKVTDGRLARGDRVRIQSAESKIKSIRISKNEVNKAETGQECGVLLEPQIDFLPGDVILAHS